jgi:hypothetical protein
VAASYHSGFADNEHAFYSVQVLPELLEVLLLLVPKLMPRAALGRGFQRWWASTHGGLATDGSLSEAEDALGKPSMGDGSAVRGGYIVRASDGGVGDAELAVPPPHLRSTEVVHPAACL